MFDLGSWVEIWTINLSLALVGMVMSSSKLLFFFDQRSFKLRCETVKGVEVKLYCVIVIKHVAFFNICARLLVTMLLHLHFRMSL